MRRKLNTKDIFRFISNLGLVLSVALLPTDRFPYLHYTPLKLGAISLILLLTGTIYSLYKALMEKRYREIKKYTLVCTIFLLLPLGYLLSTVYAVDRGLAIGATKALLLAVIRSLCIYILLAEKTVSWLIFKKSIYIVTFIIVIFGFFQFFGDVFGMSQKFTDLKDCCTSNSTYVFPRIHSVSIEPLYLANFLLIPFWFLSFDLLRPKIKKTTRTVLTLLFVLTTSLFITTNARSAFLGLSVGLILFLHIQINSAAIVTILKRWFLPLFLSTVFALTLILMSGKAATHIQKQAINGSEGGARESIQLFTSHAVNPADDSAKTRFSTWPKAYSYFKERPFTGYGAYNSRIVLNSNQENNKPGALLQPFNNDYLGIIVDLGLLGIILLFPIIYMIGFSVLDMRKGIINKRLAPVLLIVISSSFQSLFFHSILLPRTWVFLALISLIFFDKRLSDDSIKDYQGV